MVSIGRRAERGAQLAKTGFGVWEKTGVTGCQLFKNIFGKFFSVFTKKASCTTYIKWEEERFASIGRHFD